MFRSAGPRSRTRQDGTFDALVPTDSTGTFIIGQIDFDQSVEILKRPDGSVYYFHAGEGSEIDVGDLVWQLSRRTAACQASR